jgi:hypothetical protein
MKRLAHPTLVFKFTVSLVLLESHASAAAIAIVVGPVIAGVHAKTAEVSDAPGVIDGIIIVEPYCTPLTKNFTGILF